jgi:long-chain acyl-CoA synthetase
MRRARPGNPVLLEAWRRTLRTHGDTPAITEASTRTTVTFRELEARADAWGERHATELRDLRGRAVVFAMPNGAAWFELFLGLLKAGAVAVPLDAAEPATAQRRLADVLRAGAWWNGERLELLAAPRRYRYPMVCLIKLTSGTTGRPRALVFTGHQLLADAKQVTSTMGIGSGDVNYALIPFGHSYGLGNLTLPLLAHGVPVVCGSSPLPHAIAADFAAHRPTIFPGVPAMWRSLAASDVSLPGLRLAISAGAPLPPEVARDFATRFGQRIHSFYGSSETGGITYDRTGAATLAGQVGRALQGVHLRALSGQRLEVSSAAVLTLGNRRRHGSHGAWVMPDRVALDIRDNATLLGRRGTTVKIAGRRVNLAEVADRLRRFRGVREAWVGLTRGVEPALGAVVAGTSSATELRSALHADTAPWKIPKKLIVVAALPITPRGKPDTRAMQALIG